LPFCGLTHKPFACFGKSYNGGRCSSALRIGNDHTFISLENGYARGCRAEVNANDFRHMLSSPLLISCSGIHRTRTASAASDHPSPQSLAQTIRYRVPAVRCSRYPERLLHIPADMYRDSPDTFGCNIAQIAPSGPGIV